MVASAEDILNGPEYFTCPNFGIGGTRMLKRDCISRQRKANAAKDSLETLINMSFDKCRNCEEGRKVLEEVGMQKIPLCTECGERPAMVNKHGKVVNGKCGHCHGRLMSKAKSKKAAEKPRQVSQEEVGFDPSIFGAPELIVLDTTPYPEVLEHLEEAALTHIRTVEHQALAYIVKGLQGDGYGKEEGV